MRCERCACGVHADRAGTHCWRSARIRCVTSAKTCSDVGGSSGNTRPSFSSSAGSITVPSDEAVADEESDNAGVEVNEGAPEPVRARASAWERAER